jgi:hypothetical protein
MLWEVEEVGERLGEILQRLLLNDTGPFGQPPVLGAGGGQLPALASEADGAAPRLPPGALLKSEVVHKPSMSAVSSQDSLLGGRRIRAVPELMIGLSVLGGCDR